MTEIISACAKTEIKPGDLVLVSYPPSEKTNNPAHKLDGQQFVVKKKCVIKSRKNQRISRVYYELYDANSKAGVPYGFLEDELIKL